MNYCRVRVKRGRELLRVVCLPESQLLVLEGVKIEDEEVSSAKYGELRPFTRNLFGTDEP